MRKDLLSVAIRHKRRHVNPLRAAIRWIDEHFAKGPVLSEECVSVGQFLDKLLLPGETCTIHGEGTLLNSSLSGVCSRS
jgi:hypothetical protein